MSDRTFLELAVRGEVLPEEIDEFVDVWHDSASHIDLHRFLGMTWEEYSLWVENPALISLIISARISRTPLIQAVNDNVYSAERLAARTDNPQKVARLKQWIEAQR